MAIAKEKKGHSEYYTPHTIAVLARSVLGRIDLDPASTATANQAVQAMRYYTAAEDGLKHQWHGTVFVNPPYRQPLIQLFCEKLVSHINTRDVKAAICLTNNATETKWAQLLLIHADAVCFPRGRVPFWTADQIRTHPLQGQMITYFGPHPCAFARVFTELGFATVLKKKKRRPKC